MISLCKMLQFAWNWPVRGCRCYRQCWVRNWILGRPLFGQYEVLIDQLLNSDELLNCGYRKFVRLSPELSRELVERVGPVIKKQKTRIPTFSWTEDSHHRQIPGHRGLLQEPDVWLQGGFQHNSPVCARGVLGHLPDLQG